MSEKVALFIDCDPGTDDAGALLIALTNPACEVVGISTVQGNAEVDQCTLNAFRVLNVVGRKDVPVYRGCADPLVGTYKRSEFHGLDGLGDHKDEFIEPDLSCISSEHAADAIVRASIEHEGRLVLVCLGPLTNLSKALKMDPQLGKRLKRCVIMGGSHEGKGNATPYAEFNFFQDPEAANFVMEDFNSPVLMITMELARSSAIGWEIYDPILERENDRCRFFRNVTRKTHTYLRSVRNGYSAYDELALVLAIYPSIIHENAKCQATVDTSSAETRGRMLVNWKDDGNIDVVLKVDFDRFTEIYASSFR